MHVNREHVGRMVIEGRGNQNGKRSVQEFDRDKSKKKKQQNHISNTK